MTDTVALQLPDAGSLPALRWALVTAVRLHQGSVDYHVGTADVRRAAGDNAEAARNKRQATVHARRRDLTQQLLDQLPAEPEPKDPA